MKKTNVNVIKDYCVKAIDLLENVFGEHVNLADIKEFSEETHLKSFTFGGKTFIATLQLNELGEGVLMIEEEEEQCEEIKSLQNVLFSYADKHTSLNLIDVDGELGEGVSLVKNNEGKCIKLCVHSKLDDSDTFFIYIEDNSRVAFRRVVYHEILV